MSSFTVCFRAFQMRDKEPSPVVSYATKETPSELLIILRTLQKELIMLCCHGAILKVVGFLNLIVFSWMNVCVSFSSKDRQIEVTINGETLKVSVAELVPETHDLQVEGGGSLYIGNLQMQQNVMSDKLYSFAGYIADVFITDASEKEEFSHAFTTCQDAVPSGQVIMHQSNSESFELSNIGSQFVEFNASSFCQGNGKLFFLFLEKRNYIQVKPFCEALGMSHAAPTSDDDNEKMMNVFTQDGNECGGGAWIGYKYNKKLHMPYNENGLVNFSSFSNALSGPRDGNCVQFMKKDEDGNFWNVESCFKEKCFLCMYKQRNDLTLRGLCHSSKFDKIYRIHKHHNGKPIFLGNSNSLISWVPNDKNIAGTWIIRSENDSKIFGEMTNLNQFNYPVGLNQWSFHNDNCEHKEVSEILLTTCNQEMFSCNDGQCIEKEARCDLRIDCRDKSDELGCEVAIVPKGYDSRLPPPKTEDTEITVVTEEIYINAIHSLDIMRNLIEVEFRSRKFWFDPRLKFRNLKEKTTSNLIEIDKSGIWAPQMFFYGENGCVPNSDLKQSLSWAERWSDVPKDDVSILQADSIFEGSKNPLFLQQIYKNEYVCHINLTNYPFDVQHCSIFSILSRAAFDVVDLKNIRTEFIGQPRLLEYKLIAITSHNYSYNEMRGIKIDLTFENMYKYYISSTYIPTLLMCTICYSTFWFDLEDFTNRIMVSLTSLLVLTSLFSQISSLLPQTSYLKLVDIWFVACIIADFVMITLQVIIGALSATSNKVMNLKKSEAKITAGGVNRFSQVASFLSLALSTCIYTVYVSSL